MSIPPELQTPTAKMRRRLRQMMVRALRRSPRVTPPKDRSPVGGPLVLDSWLVRIICRRCFVDIAHTVQLEPGRLVVGYPNYELSGNRPDFFAFTCPECRNSHGIPESELVARSIDALSSGQTGTIRVGKRHPCYGATNS